MKQYVQNGMEKFNGELQGFQKNPDLIVQKDALEAKVRELAASPGHEAQKQALDKLDAILADEFKTARQDFERGATFGGSRLLGTALQLTRWAEEREKKDPDRRPGFQQRD